MQAQGKFKSASYTLDGKLQITFEIEKDAAYQIDDIKDGLLKIEATKWKEKRSLNANAYFWQLVDKIGKRTGIDKWDMYLYLISKYGVFVDLEVKEEAIQTLNDHFRYIEVLDRYLDYSNEYEEVLTVRAYWGSSTYNTKEMSDLISGTVEDAKEIGGIEVLTPKEMCEMINAWKGR